MKQLVEQKMREMMDILEAGLTKEQFLEAFKGVVEQVKKMEANLSEKIDGKTQSAEARLAELEGLYQQAIAKLADENTSTLSNVRRWAMEEMGKLFAKSKINEKIGEVDAKLQEMNAYELPDASSIALEASKMAQDGLLPLIPIVEKVEEQIPSLGAPIRDALEKLTGDDRLEIKAIKDLQEELDELKKQIQMKTMVYGGGGTSSGGGRIVKSYDLSASLDGSTKTFSLPAFWRIISVHLSSAPFTLRATTDYTVSGSQITFTSEIDAPTVLAVGQTCTVVYSE